MYMLPSFFPPLILGTLRYYYFKGWVAAVATKGKTVGVCMHTQF